MTLRLLPTYSASKLGTPKLLHHEYIYIPISRKLDEEQSKHAGLAHHKKKFWLCIVLLNDADN
jgi:hypothetical protein